MFTRYLQEVAKRLALLFVTVFPASSQAFPTWRVGANLPLSTLWDEAPIIVVASLVNPQLVGSTGIAAPPKTVDSRVKRLYWCSGELRVSSVLKGELPKDTTSLKYLFASIRPLCSQAEDRNTDHARQIQIWFIRAEGANVRPLYDAGSHRKLVLVRKPGELLEKLSREDVALRLLDPLSWDNGLLDLAGEMFVIGHMVCELLGSERCINELLLMAGRQEVLRAEVCDFLRVTYQYNCRTR